MVYIAPIDFEVLTLKGPLIVSEVGAAIIENGKIIDKYHSIIKPYGHAHISHKYITKNITGLTLRTLYEEGKDVEVVKEEFYTFLSKYKEVCWVARDPRLENRVVAEWYGCQYVEVVEVTDVINKPEYVRKVGRPKKVRQYLHDQDLCPHHCSVPSNDFHCAYIDALEIACWVLMEENKRVQETTLEL